MRFATSSSRRSARSRSGDPRDEKTVVGPIISEDDAKRIEQTIHDAVEQGGKLLCGGGRKGKIVEPAVSGKRAARCGGIVRGDLWAGDAALNRSTISTQALADGERQPIRLAGRRVHARYRQDSEGVGRAGRSAA